MENDEIEIKNHPEEYETVKEYRDKIKDESFGDDFEAMVADERYKYITKHFAKAIVKKDGERNVLNRIRRTECLPTEYGEYLFFW